MKPRIEELAVTGQPTIHCLSTEGLRRFLATTRVDALPTPGPLAEQLTLILEKANEFVPSESGSILLDDPAGVRSPSALLTFIAAFGPSSRELVGQRIEISQGIAGLVYRSGKSYQTGAAPDDEHYFAQIDATIGHSTESLIAIPIRLGDNVCGVLELLRKAPYAEQDRRLLEIFAGYISSSVHNALVARRASDLARRDSLTGLFNDLHLHDELDQAVHHSLNDRDSDLALVFIDLDRFKEVNDVHGHLAGSQVLHEFGSLLLDELDRHPGFAARYGGDEFVICLKGYGIDAAEAVADGIREAFRERVFCSEPGKIQQQPLHLSGLTASCGVASLHEHVSPSLTWEGEPRRKDHKLRLLRLADAAMYRAKELGRDRTVRADSAAPSQVSITVPRAGIDRP